ncbi:RimK family alpha-L-glutamate ligase [Streptomyces sp. NPDC058045]|uniref:ATP-grasp domain-containing protein n=1 Tax=Streptomyces sp. NPDC058045 TaxID=3346311 RepID=UPI0036E99B70
MASTAGSIALVTCRPQPGIHADEELPLLVGALRAAGAEASVVEWDDPAVDWARHDLAVIRSTWDYTWRSAEFTAWVDRCAAATTLANPPEVIRWNCDKRYLGDLADAGVPVVDTRYLPPDGGAELPGAGAWVVKPTAGAGARYAARYDLGDPADARTAAAHLARLHDEGLTAMVQPYMRHIDVTGERALLFCGGRFLHAIRKGAVLSPGTAYDVFKTPHPELRPWRPTAAEHELAEQALAAVPGDPRLLYARVDLVDGEDGAPRLMELELIEPNLFLGIHPASLPAVAEAITAAART